MATQAKPLKHPRNTVLVGGLDTTDPNAPRLVPLLVGPDGALLSTATIDETTLATKAGAANGLVTPLVASATGVTSLAARATRRSVIILCLDDSAETIYYGFTTGVNASTGMRLKAGQSTVEGTTAAIFFFGAAGTGTIRCSENFD